jgi:hypothetical protein
MFNYSLIIVYILIFGVGVVLGYSLGSTDEF